MSDPRTNPRDRWRHAWAGFVLGAIAVIALGLIAFVVSTQRSARPEARAPMLLTEVPPSTGAPASPTAATALTGAGPSAGSSGSRSRPLPGTRVAPMPSRPLSTPPSTPPGTSEPAASPPTPSASGGPCGSGAPCVVSGTGAVQAALSGYRQAHGGTRAVPAVVTSAAQRCAQTGGDGSTCAGPFAVARERQQDGHLAVGDIGSGYGNWLLDPRLRAVEVGWAYDPRSAEYVCALIART